MFFRPVLKMANQEETIEQRQENEIQILQSVFYDDFKDLRKKAWKVWRPADILLHLRPQQSMSEIQNEMHSTIDLHIQCNEDYPNKIPVITLENGKGLSTVEMEELRKELVALAVTLKGEVMVLDLAQHVQRFLHQHKRPAFQSFYDEMLQNKRQVEEQLAAEKLHREEIEAKLREIQHKEIAEEIQRKREELKGERRNRRITIQKHSESGEIIGTELCTKELEIIASNGKTQACDCCSDNNLSMLFFTFGAEDKKIHRGKCLGHSRRGSVTYGGLDLVTGEFVIIVAWVVTLNTKKGRRKSLNAEEANKLANVEKQIGIFEQELFNILKKLDNPLLIKYLGITHISERDKISIYILMEHVNGSPLSSFLSQGIPMDFRLLQYSAKMALEALDVLHRHDIVHRNLRASSLFTTKEGLIKMSDYSLDKKAFDLYNSYLSEPVHDFYPPSLARSSKKGDVYRLGLIILSLSIGNLVTDVVPKIPISLCSDLQDFLNRMLSPNEHERWSCQLLLEHPFLKANPHLNLRPPDTHYEDDKDNLDEDGEVNKVFDLGPIKLFSQNVAQYNSVGHSRLYDEFEIISFVGSGGFGNVLKARNKLDGCFYAIKRIPLNPSKLYLNRKIMREVKLLSRLNHENVVRYYNSWIETANEEQSSEETTSEEKQSTTTSEKLDLSNKLLAPPKIDGSVEWSTSYEYSCIENNQLNSPSSSSEDDEDLFGSSFLCHDSSMDSIRFEENSPNRKNLCNKSDAGESSCTTENKFEPPKSCQFMYIQMEFCERSTLRTAINEGIKLERMWRLFRELVEGLVHIHQQGMIHRDLKPVNIFLDSNDHVKIGDFGLATTDILNKVGYIDSCIQDNAAQLPLDVSELMTGSQLTGQVGTALYVAPELISSNPNARLVYNQKVDIYSLGIIFFEMSYPAPATAMERINILTRIRMLEIYLPDDVCNYLNPQQVYFVRWLLQHDLNLRPTSEELLASPSLPPPLLEEAQLNEMLRHTVSNPQSKSYKHMISALFRQETSQAHDFVYDHDDKGAVSTTRQLLTFNATVNTIEKIFKKHGAIKMPCPTLMPKTNWCSDRSDSSVHLMDHAGGIVFLPSNLRISLARNVARRDITSLKHYAIEKVYRERKVYGCHPKELHQCTFDIITPGREGVLPDAEVLVTVSEIISEFPSLQNRGYLLRINHVNLLRAILLHCDIPEGKHKDIMVLLADNRIKSLSKGDIHKRLVYELNISEHSTTCLFQYIDIEDSLSRVELLLRSVSKRRGQAASLAQQSLRELTSVINYSQEMGMKLPVLVAPTFVFGLSLYSGIVFQFCYSKKVNIHKEKNDVLAVGGNYTALISRFVMGKETNQSGIGFSLALEKIVNAQLENKEAPPLHDVAICSVGQSPMLKEKCNLLKILWSAGIHTHMIYDSSLSLEEISVFCKDNSIAHLLILKDSDVAQVKIRTFEKDRFTEKKVMLLDIVDYIPKLFFPKNDTYEPTGNIQCNKLELSRSSTSLDSERTGPTYRLTFLQSEKIDKMSSSSKRRIEALILSNLSGNLPFSNKASAEVIVVDLPSSAIKIISTYLELSSGEEEFESSISNIMERLPRHKYLTKLLDTIHELKFQKLCSIIVLYSLPDSSYKVIL